MAITRNISSLDRLIGRLDLAVRAIAGVHRRAVRPSPGRDLLPAALDAGQQRMVSGMMRVNHTGEVCAQALYLGQGLLAEQQEIRAVLVSAAAEEADHLHWCAERLDELGSRPSFLNPLWFTGAFALALISGWFGDRWSMAFLRETELQVGEHLRRHLDRLPREDRRSRAIVSVMYQEEIRHAQNALNHGAAQLPAVARFAMRLQARVMTTVAFWI